MKHFTSSTKRGFTLVEILVVLSIIALLVVLALAGYSESMKAARAAACSGNLKQLAVAALLYSNEHNGAFPQADLPTSWDVTLQPYLGGTPQQPMAVLRCPSDSRPLVSVPGGYWQSNYPRSYAISGVSGPQGVAGSSWSPTVIDYSRRFTQIAVPSQTILFCECFAPGNFQYNAGYSWTPGGIDTSFYPAGQLTHGMRMNFAFVDGHVEALTLDQEVNYWNAIR